MTDPELDLDMGFHRVEGTISGVVQNPDIQYTKTSLNMVQENNKTKEEEEYRKDKKRVTRTIPGEWQRKPDKSDSDSLIGNPSALVECWRNVRFTGEETIKGVDCKTIESSFFSYGGCKKIFTELIGALPPDREIKPPQSSGKIYVGIKDNLPYRFVFSLTMEFSNPRKEKKDEKGRQFALAQTIKKICFSIDMAFFDYDKNVEIKFPDEVRKLLESDAEEKDEPGAEENE